MAQINLKTSRLAFNKVDKRPILAFNPNGLCVITPESVPHLACNYNRFVENSRNSQTETVISEYSMIFKLTYPIHRPVSWSSGRLVLLA